MKNKRFFWTAGVLIVIILFFVPLPYYQNTTICTMSFPSTCSASGWKLGAPLILMGFTRQPVPQTTPTPIVTPSPTPTPNPTANWKVYSTSKFSFKYPPNLLVKETDRDFFVLYQEGGSIINTEILLIDARLSGNNVDYVTAVEKAKKEIVNTKAESIENGVKISGTLGSGYGEGAPITVTYFKYGQGTIFVETNTENRDELVIYDQILSTFKFTN